MPTTVELQGIMRHGLIPLWILFIVLISPLIIKYRKKRQADKPSKAGNKVNPKLKPVPVSVKESYVNKLRSIEREYKTGNKSSKECYQLLSMYIRLFVKEYAGVDVTVKTLAEIRGMNIPKLERLISGYYKYEFSPDAEGDIDKAIDDTIEAVNFW